MTITLNSIVKSLESVGRVKRINKSLSRVLEPTTYIKNAEREGVAVIFKVENSRLSCISNIINSRKLLLKLINASTEEELYKRLNTLISSSEASTINEYVEKGFFSVGEFNHYYEKFNGWLDEIPSIKFYEGDGGEYITSSIVIAETPDMPNHYNASIHRLMRIGNEGYAIRLVPRHLYNIYLENRNKGKETTIAIVIGADPLTLLSASSSPPYGVFELIGYKYLSGKPLEMVFTPKYGIPIPAHASLVIEGRITLEFVDEGPFVDVLQLYDRVRKQPLVKVESIYVSKSSNMFHVILPGGVEHRLLMGLPREAAIWDSVRKVVPRVVKVRLTPGGGSWLNAVVSIRKFSEGEGKLAILAAFSAHPSLKNVVVVDDDIDPDNPTEVEWAITTRFQASNDLIVIKGAKGSTLDPSSKDGLTDKVGIDATAPLKDRSKYIRVK